MSLVWGLGCVDARLGRERCDCRSCRPLGHVGTAFPAVDACEGDAEPVGELLLREVEVGANGLQSRRDGSRICHI